MEKWTKLREDHVGSGKEKLGSAFDLGFSVDECSYDSCEERLRGLFDRLLVVFMKEKSESKCIRPIPVLSGEGRSVDLFKLFWVVRKIGGYDNISTNNLWGFVADECGLGFGEIAFVKLTYSKYLNEFDQWLREVNIERGSENRKSRVYVTLDLLSWELEVGFKILMSVAGEEQENDIKFVECSTNRENVIPGSSESELHFSSVGGNSGGVEDKKHIADDNKSHGSLCNGNATDFQLPERRIAENFQISSDIDRSIDQDLAASARRVIEKAVNGFNGLSTASIDNNSGTFCFEDRDNAITSAKQVIEKVFNKVQMCGEAVGHDCCEKISSRGNGKALTPTVDAVVEKVICKTDPSGNNAKDEKKFEAVDGIDILVPARRCIERVRDSWKRKRGSESLSDSWKRKPGSGSLSGMLKWLTHAAKHSDDPKIGPIPESTKWGKYGKEKFWVQALLVREALLVRRRTDTNSGECLQQEQQKKIKMHPSMYEDDVLDHQLPGKVRCSKRIPTPTKHTLCSCCNSRATPQNQIDPPKQEEERPDPKAPLNPVTQAAPPKKNSNELECMEMPIEKQVSIGPSFQAEVPEWTGMISESDSKWLGMRMWPPENNHKQSNFGWDLMKERQIVCSSCEFPNSVECVRFHIAEKRFRLKQELGALFYRWGFNRMGEEVSLSWTKEEEKKFNDMMRSYASVPNRFWNYAYRFLPGKTREKLVSYYFNAFLIQRRSYQNRVTPNDIDSDDDEKECGLIGDGFGYKALHIPGSKSISCTMNKESFELV